MKMKSSSTSHWRLSLAIASLIAGLAVFPAAYSSPQDAAASQAETGDLGINAQSGDDINAQAGEGATEAQEPAATNAEAGDDEATVSDSGK